MKIIKSFMEEVNGKKVCMAIAKCPICRKEKTYYYPNAKRNKTCGCQVGWGGWVESVEYTTHSDMKRRCKIKNKKNPDYFYYSKKGIKVCDCIKNFQNFYFNLGPRPSKKHSIDRINGNKNYCACTGNLRWATTTQQSQNRKPPKKKSKLPTNIYKKINGFVVQKHINKKRYYIGFFRTLELAKEAYSEFQAKNSI